MLPWGVLHVQGILLDNNTTSPFGDVVDWEKETPRFSFTSIPAIHHRSQPIPTHTRLSALRFQSLQYTAIPTKYLFSRVGAYR